MTHPTTSPATMNDPRRNADQEQPLRAIAYLVNQIRPDWDTPGVMAALRRCADRDLAALVHAATWAANNPATHHTPAVIALDGPHWRIQPDPDPQPEPDHGPVCHICRRPARDHGRIPLCAGHDFVDARTAPALCARCGTHRDHHQQADHSWISTADLATQRKGNPA